MYKVYITFASIIRIAGAVEHNDLNCIAMLLKIESDVWKLQYKMARDEKCRTIVLLPKYDNCFRVV